MRAFMGEGAGKFSLTKGCGRKVLLLEFRENMGSF
jgi:hypothetical protein